jgi:TRAP-type mannitol/chloroaromatic compound transport system substrate-binding protein
MLLPEELIYKLAVDFWDEVREETDGQIDVTMYPGGAVVPTMEILPSVMDGVIEMGYSVPGYYRDWAPVYGFGWGFPSIALSFFDSYRLYFSYGLIDVWKEETLAKSGGKMMLRPICSEDFPLIGSKPVRGVDDFKGLKMRSTGLAAEWFAAMGASTTYISGEEIYTAFATGLIDVGHYGTFGTTVDLKLYEVSDYYMVPPLCDGMVMNWFINTEAWNSLPSELQTYLELKMLELFAPYGKAYFDQYKTAEEVWAEHCTRIEIPAEEQAKMNEIGLEVAEKFATDAASRKAFGIVKEYLADRKAYTGR